VRLRFASKDVPENEWRKSIETNAERCFAALFIMVAFSCCIAPLPLNLCAWLSSDPVLCGEQALPRAGPLRHQPVSSSFLCSAGFAAPRGD
jgi:hypothetical protein